MSEDIERKPVYTHNDRSLFKLNDGGTDAQDDTVAYFVSTYWYPAYTVCYTNAYVDGQQDVVCQQALLSVYVPSLERITWILGGTIYKRADRQTDLIWRLSPE